MSNLKNKPLIVVDLNTGSYLDTRTGHECYNLERNKVDGKYYGYCPPYDNIDTTKLGVQKWCSVKNAIVVYVTKAADTNNRKVVGFTDNATILPERTYNEKLQRLVFDKVEKKWVHCSYTIVSDYMFDLREEKKPFIIRTSDYNPWMFRMQRFYGGTYPELERKLLAYIESFLNNGLDNDDADFQQQIQDEEVSSDQIDSDTSLYKPKYVVNNGTRVVERNSRYSKMALVKAGYLCACDSKHVTFKTPKGVPYMEGHHLIPCTASNAERYWDRYKRNIDCVENIVCVCPNCHRCIHFGSEMEKHSMITNLYEIQKTQLKSVGINISLEELIELYK